RVRLRGRGAVQAPAPVTWSCGRWWLRRFPVRRRSGGSASRAARVRRAAGRERARGPARAVRDADAQHRRRAHPGGARTGAGERRRRRAGGRAPGRDARPLPRGGRARERGAPGVHARDLAREYRPAPVALLDHAIARVLPAVPRRLVRKLASPYIAGPTLEDAVRVVRRLNAEGKLATLDVLGEE